MFINISIVASIPFARQSVSNISITSRTSRVTVCIIAAFTIITIITLVTPHHAQPPPSQNDASFFTRSAETLFRQHRHLCRRYRREVPRGQYKPISIIYRDEGGDQAALIATINIVTDCMQRQQKNELICGRYPWVKFNKQSKRIEVMHLHSGFKDSHVESWSITTSSQISEETLVADAVATDTEKATPEKRSRKAFAILYSFEHLGGTKCWLHKRWLRSSSQDNIDSVIS